MSKNVSFVKTPEEIRGMYANSSLYVNRKVLQFAWAIDENVYKRILPPGLEPVAPIVSGFVAYFPSSGFSLPAYSEGALFLPASCGGKTGGYCIAMPIDCDNEAGILLGRDLFGYPKKAAKIVFQRRGDDIYASIERNGIKFFEINATAGELNSPELENAFPAPKLGVTSYGDVYLLDYKLECVGHEASSLSAVTFNNIKLFRQNNATTVHSSLQCRIDIKLTPSEDDPWAELAPVKLIGGRYEILNCEMFGTELAYEYKGKEAEAVLPYLFTRYDTLILGKRLELH